MLIFHELNKLSGIYKLCVIPRTLIYLFNIYIFVTTNIIIFVLLFSKVNENILTLTGSMWSNVNAKYVSSINFHLKQ